jgi:hypothetical protein
MNNNVTKNMKSSVLNNMSPHLLLLVEYWNNRTYARQKCKLEFYQIKDGWTADSCHTQVNCAVCNASNSTELSYFNFDKI